MDLICPFCDEIVSDDAFDEDDDVMRCPKCEESCILSDLREGKVPPAVDIAAPPTGTWFEQRPDGVRVGMSHRMLPALFFLVPFFLAWTSGSVGVIYGSQFADHEFDPVMSLFGIPFLLASLVLVAAMVMTVAGKTEVTVSPTECVIFTGAFGIGFRKRFDPATVLSVSESCSMGTKSKSRYIEIKTPEQTHLISWSKDPKMLRYVYAVLRQFLSPATSTERLADDAGYKSAS